MLPSDMADIMKRITIVRLNVRDLPHSVHLVKWSYVYAYRTLGIVEHICSLKF